MQESLSYVALLFCMDSRLCKNDRMGEQARRGSFAEMTGERNYFLAPKSYYVKKTFSFNPFS